VPASGIFAPPAPLKAVHCAPAVGAPLCAAAGGQGYQGHSGATQKGAERKARTGADGRCEAPTQDAADDSASTDCHYFHGKVFFRYTAFTPLSAVPGYSCLEFLDIRTGKRFERA